MAPRRAVQYNAGMFLTRKIGSVLRGKATPLQVLLATTFGGLLGFIPGFFLPGDLGGGFAQAPGLILLLLACVLILNANLAVFGLVTLVAKLISLFTLPIAYSLGTFLVDAMPGLFAGLVNGKVTAWFGLEHYATTGGLVIGLCFGVLSGLLLNFTIKAIRTKMANAEENSDAYKKYSQKRWVKVGTWLVLGGGKGKTSWKELAESKKKGLPIRIFGVLLVVVAGASLWVFQQWFSTPILTHNLQKGLQAANGATVDVDAATVDLGAGVLRIKNLAIADGKALGQDLFAADELVATLDTGELLRKRIVIDELKSDSARTGTARKVPGVLLPSTEVPPPEPEPPAGMKSVEEYLKDYEVWKQRFDQAREWFEVIAGSDETPPAQKSPEVIQQERQKETASMSGLQLARVAAEHLLEGSPRVLIRKIDIKGIPFTYNGQPEVLNLSGLNLSTAPSLVDGVPSLGLKAQSDKLMFEFAGRSKASPAMGFQFACKQIPVDSVFGKLKLAGAAPVRGGLMDLDSKGTFLQAKGQAMTMDLPLQVALKDTTFAFAGAKETKVENLLLPIGLRGSLTRPSFSLDDQVLKKALLDAGKAELANFVQGKAGKLLEGLPTQLQGVDVKGLLDPTKSPEQIAADAKAKAEAEAARLAEEAKKKAEEEKKRLEAEAKKKLEEEAKKRLPGGLQGLLPGGKKN